MSLQTACRPPIHAVGRTSVEMYKSVWKGMFDANIPARNTSCDRSKPTHMTWYDASRASKLLGISYFPGIGETTRDVIAQFKENG